MYVTHFEGFSSDLEKNTGDFLLLKIIFTITTRVHDVCERMCRSADGGSQGITLRSWFFPTYRVSGTESRPPGLHGKGLYQPDHFTGLIYSAQF